MSDCSDCKEEVYNVYIDYIHKEIWPIEKLSLLLYKFRNLGYTTTQSKLVAESIMESSNKFKIFSGDKETSFALIDYLILNGISSVSIVKKKKDLFK